MAKQPPRPSLKRPYPPEHLVGINAMLAEPTFEPAPDVAEWLAATFINPDSPLVNEEHRHLQGARIGVLWTNQPNARAGRAIVGQCELMPPGGTQGRWAKGRAAQQMRQWFGDMPDFVITLDAQYAAQADDATFAALVEHEALHAGQEKDANGLPKFTANGEPKYAIRAHDVETFVCLAARYGAVEANVAQLVAAASKPPSIGRAQLGWACGTCLKVAA